MFLTLSFRQDGSLNSYITQKKNAREFKGKSLTELVPDYTVIDIETTGLDPNFDEIIEVSAIRVRSHETVDTFSTLVKPTNEIDEFITELTGITNEMLESAPPIASVLPDFMLFLGSDILIGHNVNFDINFLYDEALYLQLSPLRNDFVDTMRLGRKLFPNMPNHKLATMAKELHIKQVTAHRALADCETTKAIYSAIIEYVNQNSIDWNFVFARHNLHASDIHAQTDHFDPDSPFLGKVCVFTGALERMVRKDAMQIVANLGGICADGVTAKTNFLILGNLDYASNIKDGKSSKQKKAESLILKGKDLTIISEEVFYDMIAST